MISTAAGRRLARNRVGQGGLPMLAHIQTRPVASLNGRCLPSRAEFLHTLRQLGAKLGVRYCKADRRKGGIKEVQKMSLTCSHDSWLRAFGEPNGIAEYHETQSDRSACPLLCWEYSCLEGLVSCVGQLRERRSEGPSVVLMKVTFSLNFQTIEDNKKGPGLLAERPAHLE